MFQFLASAITWCVSTPPTPPLHILKPYIVAIVLTLHVGLLCVVCMPPRWWVAICFNLWRVVVRGTKLAHAKRVEPLLHAACWGIPAVQVAGLYGFSVFGTEVVSSTLQRGREQLHGV